MSNEFGEALRAKRLAFKISVADAAALIGASHTTWVRWEAGITQPSLEMMKSAALMALEVEGNRRTREGVKAGPGRPVGPAGPAKPRT